MPLISRWQLFSAFCLISSMGKIEELYCNTIVGIHKGQLGECSFCRGDISVVGSNL